MKNTKQGKLAIQALFNIGIVVLVLITILDFITVKSVRKSTVKIISSLLYNEAPLYSDKIGLSVDKYLEKMTFYSKSDVVRNGTEKEIVDWLINVSPRRSKDFDYMIFCGADGIAHVDTGTSTNIKDREYFKKMMTDGVDSYVDDAVISKTTGKPIVHACVAAYNEQGKKIGFFSGIITVSNVTDLVKDIKIEKVGYIVIIDGNGTIIGHPDPLKEMQSFYEDYEKNGMSEFVNDIKTKDSGYYLANMDGTKFNMYFSSIPSTNWTAIINMPNRFLDETANTVRLSLIIGNSIMGIIILLIIGIILAGAIKPVLFVEKSIKEIAQGDADLTKRIEVKSNNEIGLLVEGFNKFIGKLHSIISDIKISRNELNDSDDKMVTNLTETTTAVTQMVSNISNVSSSIKNQSQSVTETAGAVIEISQNIVSLDKMIENHASGIEEASAAVEEMIGNITSVNQSVEHMANSFNVLSGNAKSGTSVQEKVNKQIENIAQQSEMLESANSAIASIASQTNLLAMNAAIEAAHAGEAGKGFSVVADEIRKLSETSTMQSKTIGEQLKKIQDAISTVVSSSGKSEKMFNEIVVNIDETDQLIIQIKSAMEEQLSGSKQIGEALHSMNDSTSEVRTASKEMSAGQKAILEEVKHLQEETENIKNQVSEISIGTNRINVSQESLNEISKDLRKSVERISTQIELFKV